MLFRNGYRLENDYIDRMMYVLFEARRPLTQDEITERVKKQYRVRMNPKKTNWHLDYAVNHGLLFKQLSDQETTYYPMISEEAFRQKQEEEFQKILQDGGFSEEFTNKFVTKKWTEEEYEKIKKLVDELE